MRWDVVTTEDGSPTLRFGPSGEAMHSYRGALAESLYVYGRPLSWALEHFPLVRVLSIGFGLGYGEWIAVARAKCAGKRLSAISYESDPQLYKAFDRSLGSISSASWIQAFKDVRERVAISHGMTPEVLAEEILKLPWKRRSAFPDGKDLGDPHVVLFDPFSSRTDPDLWGDGLLDSILQNMAPVSVFASFASKSNLKKRLKKGGFLQITVPGFAGKRESTFAIRGRL